MKVIRCAAVAIGSTVRCGRAPCPPRPSIRIVKSRQNAVLGPGVIVTLPTSKFGSTWSATIASHHRSRLPLPFPQRRDLLPPRVGKCFSSSPGTDPLGAKQALSRAASQNGRRGRTRASHPCFLTGRELRSPPESVEHRYPPSLRSQVRPRERRPPSQ